MTGPRKTATLSWWLAGLLTAGAITTSYAQDKTTRTVEQYLCKDVLRETGAERDVALAFMHGYLLGKKGDSTFDLGVLAKQSEAFLEHCLDNPRDKALDAMVRIKR